MKHFRNIIVFALIVFCFAISLHAQEDIPDPPIFLSASVTPGVSPGEVVLKWLPSDSADVKGYIIYKVVGNTSITFDTVYGRLSSQYINSHSLAEVQTETYRIAAFDTLLFKSMITDPHTTMLISSNYEQCAQSVDITWTAYKGFPNGVKSYHIYRKINSGEYVFLNSVDGAKLQYSDKNLDTGKTYCYYVAAVDENNIAATSPQTCQYLEGFVAPKYLIAKAAIVEDNTIILEFLVDKDAEVSEYKLMRSEYKDHGYQTIDYRPKTNQDKILFTDLDVKVDEQIFYYKIASYDLCGRLSAYSNSICNIIAWIPDNSNLTHTVEWTPADFMYGVSQYRIMGVYGESSPIEMGYYNLEDLKVVYDIDSYVRLRHARKEYVPSTYCYYVEAFGFLNDSNTNAEGYCKSNLSCTSHQPVFWVPSAFAPGSFVEKNKYFKPIISFANEKSYQMTVFNRFGMIVFTTSDITEAWDGTIKGVRAPADTYVYRISYSNSAGNNFEHTGTFNLVY